MKRIITAIVIWLILGAAPTYGIAADLGQIKKDGKLYYLVQYDTLSNGIGVWGWDIDSPSLYNGRRVATLGWVRSECEGLMYVDHLMAPDALHRNPFFNPKPSIFLHHSWKSLNYNAKSILEEISKCENANNIKGGQPPLMVLALVYGTMKNGKNSRLSDCRKGDVTLCGHIEVDAVEFGGVIHRRGDPDSRSEKLAMDLAKLAAEELARKMIGQ